MLSCAYTAPVTLACLRRMLMPHGDVALSVVVLHITPC